MQRRYVLAETGSNSLPIVDINLSDASCAWRETAASDCVRPMDYCTVCNVRELPWVMYAMEMAELLRTADGIKGEVAHA